MSEPNAQFPGSPEGSHPSDGTTPSNQGDRPTPPAQDEESASAQLAKLLGLHLPIPTYTPPDGPPEELDLPSGAPVEFEPWPSPPSEPVDAEQSLSALFEERTSEKRSAPASPPPSQPSPPPILPSPPKPSSAPLPSPPPTPSAEPLGDSVDLLQDILVRPELQEFRGRLDNLEEHTAELDSSQKNLGEAIDLLQNDMESSLASVISQDAIHQLVDDRLKTSIARVVNQLVDKRFIQLEVDWRKRIDGYFQQSFQTLFVEYFDRYVEKQGPKVLSRLAQQLSKQTIQINSRLDRLESQMVQTTAMLNTILSSLRDVSPDFETGLRLAAVEQKLVHLTRKLRALANGLRPDTLPTVADLQRLMVEDGTAQEGQPLPKVEAQLSEAEVGLRLGLVEQDLDQLRDAVGTLGQELGDREEALPDSLAVGDRLGRIETRLDHLKRASTVLARSLQGRAGEWAQVRELRGRLEQVEQGLGQLAEQMAELSANMLSMSDEPAMVDSSLSIRVRGVDPRWSAPSEWDDGEGEDDAPDDHQPADHQTADLGDGHRTGEVGSEEDPWGREEE